MTIYKLVGGCRCKPQRTRNHTYSFDSMGGIVLAGVSFPLDPFLSFPFFFFFPVGSGTGIGLLVGGLSLKRSGLSGRKEPSDSAGGIHEACWDGERQDLALGVFDVLIYTLGAARLLLDVDYRAVLCNLGVEASEVGSVRRWDGRQPFGVNSRRHV